MRCGTGSLFALTLLVLAGCKTTSEHYVALPSQISDADYREVNVSIHSVTSRSGVMVGSRSTAIPLYYKLFRQENSLAVCGYYLTENFRSHCDNYFANRWFDAATFSVNGKEIGDGSFFERHRATREGRYEAGFVVTRQQWDDAFARSTLSYRAGSFSATCVTSHAGP